VGGGIGTGTEDEAGDSSDAEDVGGCDNVEVDGWAAAVELAAADLADPSQALTAPSAKRHKENEQ
jgi:hypothetical protein